MALPSWHNPVGFIARVGLKRGQFAMSALPDLAPPHWPKKVNNVYLRLLAGLSEALKLVFASSPASVQRAGLKWGTGVPAALG